MKISKYAGVILLLSLPFSAKCQQFTPFDSTLWHTRYDEALVMAQKDSLPLILVFSGSDWCKPCIRLHEEVLVTDSFSVWAKKNAVLVSVDFPRQKKNALPGEIVKQNEMLAERYNSAGFFPLFLVLTPDEKVIGNVEFHNQSTGEFILLITKLLQSASL
ncbi:MAG TPA: thioredoxin family protein [Bacteroidales bacterium]|nr:thioredoxin family protein [Bacteroidales bacterium]HRZ48525.1 thioredoxin family protein [Bacteroidales bacterium]